MNSHHPSEFEDIFLDNEKTSFQKDFGDMLEEPHGQDATPHIHSTSGNQDDRPHAFPQDNMNQFYGNFAQPFNNHTPDWFFKNKKLPGLSGFVTLGNPGPFGDHASEFEKMDIPSLVQQDFNFNLGKIFEEEDPNHIGRRGSGARFNMEGMSRQHNNNDKNFKRPYERKRSKSKDKTLEGDPTVPEGEMSFFKNYLPMLLEHHWKEVLDNSNKFTEFKTAFDTQKNVENLMFLEEHKETYGNSFENIYHDHYVKIMMKLKEHVDNYCLDGQVILKILYDEFCGLFSELFNFIKNCTSDYCFNLMKNKTNNAKATKNNNNPQTGSLNSVPPLNPTATTPFASLVTLIQGTPYQENVQAQQKQFPSNWETTEVEENKIEHQDIPRNDLTGAMNVEKLESLANLIDYNVSRKNEPSTMKSLGPVNNAFGFKGIENINIAQCEMESVASESTRRLQRKYWSAAELQELNNMSQQYYPNSIPVEKLEEFARKYSRTLNAVQSKISKTKKENMKRQNEAFQSETNNSSQSQSQSSQRRYEVTVEKMIKGALQRFEGNVATKEEILEKIKEMFFENGLQGNEESLRNSISQILSSNKSIGIIKGTYGLKSRDYFIYDVNNAKTMKSRLQYILSNIPDNRTDIATIRNWYWHNFSDTVCNDRVWETSIAKTLKQSQEFDASSSKTKYCLLVKDAPL